MSVKSSMHVFLWLSCSGSIVVLLSIFLSNVPMINIIMNVVQDFQVIAIVTSTSFFVTLYALSPFLEDTDDFFERITLSVEFTNLDSSPISFQSVVFHAH